MWNMKNRLFCLFLLLAFLDVQAQVATIQDPDGWTNVRSEPDGESAVLRRLNEGELFWYDFEYNAKSSNWIEVTIPEEQYCLGRYQTKMTTGYIHISRLLALDSLKPYQGSDIQFDYFISDFSLEGKDIEYSEEHMPLKINGKFPWGTDGGFPYNQIDSIRIRFNEEDSLIAVWLYEDLFNINKELKIYKIKDLYIVYHWNSDGAGSYELAWAFNKTGVKQRLVGSIL